MIKSILLSISLLTASQAFAATQSVSIDVPGITVSTFSHLGEAKGSSFSDTLNLDLLKPGFIGAHPVSFNISDVLGLSNFSLALRNAANELITTTSPSTKTGSSLWSYNLPTSGLYSLTVSGLVTGERGGAYNLGLVTAPVPEPETYALMGIGLAGLLLSRRKRKESMTA